MSEAIVPIALAPAAAAAVSHPTGGDSIAKVSAGYGSLSTFGAARSVSLTGTNRHIETTGSCRPQFRALFSCPLKAVGIAESSGLHLLYRGIHSWCG